MGNPSAREWLALGGSTFGWTSDEITSRQVLDSFPDAGGTLIDTADSYSAFAPGNSGGESETIIGAWMAARGNRDRAVIGTKVSQHPKFAGLSAANVAAAVSKALCERTAGHHGGGKLGETPGTGRILVHQC